MTKISSIDLAAVSGGNATGNGQTGDRYRTDPNDNGSGTRGRGLLGPWGGEPSGVLGRAVGSLGPAAGGGPALGGGSPLGLRGLMQR